MIRHLCSHSVSVLTRAAFAACVVLIIARAGVCDDLVCETEEAKKAIAELTIAINESTKPDPDLYEERGDALMLVGDFDQAFDDYSKAIEHRRSSVNYFLRHKRVDAAVAKGDYREARDDAKRLADMLPKPEALARLALILARSPDEKVKNPKASLNAALLAERIDETRQAEVLVQLAVAAAYSVNGDFEAAVSHQEKAIAAVKGKVASEWQAQLDAYKAGKEYPFQRR